MSSPKWATYPYTDKVREAQRQVDLAGKIQENKQKIELQKKKRAEQKLRNAPWSKEVGKKTEREKRKEKKKRKREWEKIQQPLPQKSAAGSKEEEDDDEDDWEDLAREERLANKVKKCTLDSKAFDEEFSGL